ncbi:MAG: 3-phenylpropionate/trans-cinnamate dioxygenase ferredoxin component [Nocardioidaceae bacterium]|jgi:3-phenylpropionate/trans-cinnamate dioxygenase ferredoxin subunit|nr:3-phenylpropionate/trans-cinnamate dioxygenase ferredoxin component [Nocardioidaceae bacterium]
MSEPPHTDFTRACAVDDVPIGGVVAVDVEGVEVAVVRTADEFFAIRDECSHAAIALSEGDVDPDECEIECWLHGSRFDLRTGKPTGLPATEPVPVYPCRVESGSVAIDVHHPHHIDHDTTGES